MKKLKTFVLFMIFMNVAQAHDENSCKKKYKISVCSVFKNEERFLKEWIEYHRLVGVEHFYLYNTQSTDRSTVQLQRYMRQGLVTLTSWPSLPSYMDSESEPSKWSLGIQLPAYEHAAKYLARTETEWLVFLDINEYLLPANGLSLSDLLDKYDAFPGIDLPTEYFDASRIDQIPRRDLLIQSIELSKPAPRHPFKAVKKTIFKPDLYVQFNWPPYEPIFKEGRQPIAMSKREMRINKYENRFDGYLARSQPKSKAYVDNRFMSEKEISQLLELGYEIEDHLREIFRFVPELLKNMDLAYEPK